MAMEEKARNNGYVKGLNSSLTQKEQRARDMICLALDIDDFDEILGVADELKGLVGYYKLNSAFIRHGTRLIKELKKREAKIFLDLKFHDIPNTVANYARAAARLDIDIFNVHASGGYEMMKAAKEAVKNSGQLKKPKIIAVTVLTSISSSILSDELNVSIPLKEHALGFAKLASKAGLDGIVCSAAELDAIKPELPEGFFYITPGIKGTSGIVGSDQKRVFSAADAAKAGSSLLVIGRAILKAEDKKKAAYDIIKDIASAL